MDDDPKFLRQKVDSLKGETRRQDEDYEELQHSYKCQIAAFRQQTQKLQELEKTWFIQQEEYQNSYKQLQSEYDKLLQQNQLLQQKQLQLHSNNLLTSHHSADDSLNRASTEDKNQIKKKSRRHQEDMEISLDQIKKINDQIKEFFDQIPQIIYNDLTAIPQTKLILEEVQDAGDSIGISQSIQANFEMVGQILTDSSQIFRKYAELKQQNKILVQKLSNIDKLNYTHSYDLGDVWPQKESSVLLRLELLQKDKAESNKKLLDMMNEFDGKENTLNSNKKQVNSLLNENTKLKTQVTSMQRVIDKIRGYQAEAKDSDQYSNFSLNNNGINKDITNIIRSNDASIETQLQLIITQKKKFIEIILQILRKIENDKFQEGVQQILEHMKQKEQIQQKQLFYDIQLSKYEIDLKTALKYNTNQLSDDSSIVTRKTIESIRQKYNQSSQTINMLEQKIEREITLIQPVKSINQDKDHFDIKIQDVKEQLNDLKNYAYS